MAQLEHDNMLHPQILLHPLHPLLPTHILEGILVLAVQPIHDIPLKMFQQVHLALQLVRIGVHRVRLAHEYRSVSPGGDVVEVSANTTSSAFASGNGKKGNVHFIRAQHQTGTIVEVHSNTPVRQGVSHAILVAVVHPTYDEHVFFRERQVRFWGPEYFP